MRHKSTFLGGDFADLVENAGAKHRPFESAVSVDGVDAKGDTAPEECKEDDVPVHEILRSRGVFCSRGSPDLGIYDGSTLIILSAR